MLSKVLYSRAAVHVHQQASSASFRNVLQLQPTTSGTLVSGPSAASSSWGAGGSQYYSYQGYTGAGRAITHANSSSPDDTDEPQLGSKLARYRHRSSLSHRAHLRRSRSTSISVARPPISNDGVLGILRKKTLNNNFLVRVGPLVLDPVQNGHVRRHSTSSISVQEERLGSAIQEGSEPAGAPKNEPFEAITCLRIDEARASGDQLIHATGLRSGAPDPAVSHAVYNHALRALVELHPRGEPVTSIIELYNAMLALDFLPDGQTYQHIIELLLRRDAEVRRAVEKAESDGSSSRKHLQSVGAPNLRSHLLAERNYESAMTLFEAGLKFSSCPFPSSTFAALLNASAVHADINAALRVFAHREHHFGAPDIEAYTSLIQAYGMVGDLQGAKTVFSDYLKNLEKLLTASTAAVTPETTHFDRLPQDSIDPTAPFNQMIVTYIRSSQPVEALELLEHMFDQRSGDTALPAPSFATYQNLILAFCDMGDNESALAWYKRLKTSLPMTSTESFVTRTRNEYIVWRGVFGALARSGQVDELNKIVESGLANPSIEFDLADVQTWIYLNEARILASNRPQQQSYLQNLVKTLASMVPGRIAHPTPSSSVIPVVMPLFRHSLDIDLPSALSVLCIVAEVSCTPITQNADSRTASQHHAFSIWFGTEAQNLIEVAESSLRTPGTSPETALDVVLKIERLCNKFNVPTIKTSHACVALYQATASKSHLTTEDWTLVLSAFCDVELMALETSNVERPDLASLLANLLEASQGHTPLESTAVDRLVHVIRQTRDDNTARLLIEPLMETLDIPAANSLPQTTPRKYAAETSLIRLDPGHSKFVDQHIGINHPNPVSPLVCFERYEQGAVSGIFPHPETTGRLINALGRLGHLDKVHHLYEDAQYVLASLEQHKSLQTTGWFIIEDQMIAALAHAGNVDGANVHRLRILQQGGAPCADSYGALVAAVKDTTDDSSLAQELFEESERLGVVANSYLYNTVISKMAKARKTEYALELFHRMPYLALRPTPVTYAAVIGACCRVGDGDSAVFLFDEMLKLPRYRPRVPVYNNMIQFFVSQRRDRVRALRYYELMLNAGLKPTEHTYKLLLDAYGTIEPTDNAMMESTFALAASRIPLQGAHWAALINAWGTVSGNLDKTLAAFDSCKLSASSKMPDALVYESLFNALFAIERLDLVPEYIQRMKEDGVHMTAYIANVLIRGYSAAADIDRARAIFDSLVDPPPGMAAPHNHISLPSGPSSILISASTPVYREPSSWEAIIHAELNIGERDRAQALMAKLDTRMFPLGVTSRIRALFNPTSPA